MDISELMGSGDGDTGFQRDANADANSTAVMETKKFTDMPSFIISTMIMYTLFTVAGGVGKKFLCFTVLLIF